MKAKAQPPSSPRAICLAIGSAFAAGLLLQPSAGWANPEGAKVVQGQAQFHTSGNQLTVRNTAGAAINWQSFSIRPDETTHFLQPSTPTR